MNKESFIYLWYDSNNKMFYLGKHKGTPDDGYTHSSKRWQQFKSDNVPQGVRRKIIAWGIDEDMYELETKLLLNRKEKCWSRYYNISIGGDFSADYDDPKYKEMMRKCNYDNKKVQNRKRKLAKERFLQKDFRERMKKIDPKKQKGLAALKKKRPDVVKKMGYKRVTELRSGKVKKSFKKVRNTGTVTCK